MIGDVEMQMRNQRGEREEGDGDGDCCVWVHLKGKSRINIEEKVRRL